MSNLTFPLHSFTFEFTCLRFRLKKKNSIRTMHRSLKARFSNSNNSAKKNNCKGMIDRKNNARASFPDFFEVVFVRNVEDTLSYASITTRAFLLRSDFDHAVYAADVTWSANFDTHRFPNFPPKTLRLLLREVAIEKSIVHIHGQIDRTFPRQRGSRGGVPKLAITPSSFASRILRIWDCTRVESNYRRIQVS